LPAQPASAAARHATRHAAVTDPLRANFPWSLTTRISGAEDGLVVSPQCSGALPEVCTVQRKKATLNNPLSQLSRAGNKGPRRAVCCVQNTV
jgi:hypothetical protein